MARSFHELSPRTQTTVFGLLCVLAVAGAWQVSIGPGSAELGTRRAHLATLESEIIRVQAIADNLPALQRDVRSLQVALRETAASIPEERDLSQVLASLLEVASESSLDLAAWKPNNIVDKTQYSEWPIQLTLEGGFHDLGRFFDRLAAMSRLISVSDLNVKTKTRPDGRGSVLATCVATTFVFRRDVVAVQPAPTSAQGRPAMTVTTGAIRFTLGASVLVLMAAIPPHAAAQIQVGTTVGTAPPPASAGAATYESLGRRDPFVPLVARRAATTTVAVPRSSNGLGSFLLAGITVTGLVRHGGEMTAIIQGADKMSYVARAGSTLADAVIKSIDRQGVVFIDIPPPGTGALPQQTRKLLGQAAGDNR